MKKRWEIKRLGEVCDFQRGLTYAKRDEVEASGHVVLRATNINLDTNTLDLAELRHISDSVSVPATKMLKKDSLLICTASGSKKHLGKVTHIDQETGQIQIQDVFTLRHEKQERLRHTGYVPTFAEELIVKEFIDVNVFL